MGDRGPIHPATTGTATVQARASFSHGAIATQVHAAAIHHLAAGRPATVVEVQRARGSVPRDAGTRMLVTADEVVGTIGGGHLELQAIDAARTLLTEGRGRCEQRRFALGPTLGQCCGGEVMLSLSPLTATSLARWTLPAPRFHLQLYGAGHVGRAIAALLAGIDCMVQWIDQREDQFPDVRYPAHIDPICVEPVDAEVRSASPGAHVLVLTHSHELDLAITTAVLRRGDFGFLGLIGSATKRARFLHRLEERGIPAEQLARMTCPIGLPGIHGKEPEVLAVSVVAQLLQQAGAVASHRS